MDKELFPDETERDRMLRAPPGRLERLGLFVRRLRREGIAILRPRRRPHFDGVRWLDSPKLEGGKSIEVPVIDPARHHPRSIQLCGWDPLATPFWANLVIAGDGTGGAPGTTGAVPLAKSAPLSKEFGSLPNAIRDLHALRYFYNPHRIGDPTLVFPESVSRSAGYFTHTVWLADPTKETARTGVESICHWIDVNARDPEFRSVQVNIYFSGHGTPGNGLGKSAIVLHGGLWQIEALVEALLDGLARRGTRGESCRISLFIDCCHAGAIGRDFRVHLFRKREERKAELGFGTIWCRSIYCSSFADEPSFDEIGLGNSYFTAGFLQENSARRVPRSYPDLAQVSLRSDGRQTPFLMKFRPEEAPELRVPVLNWLTEEEKAELLGEDAVAEGAIQLARESGRLCADGAIGLVDWTICQAEHIRNLTLPRMRKRASEPVTVIPYDRRQTRWDR